MPKQNNHPNFVLGSGKTHIMLGNIEFIHIFK